MNDLKLVSTYKVIDVAFKTNSKSNVCYCTNLFQYSKYMALA